MISRSQSFFSTAPHLLLFPALAIILTVLGFLLVGDEGDHRSACHFAEAVMAEASGVPS